jgi:L-asparaginase II
VTGRPLDASSAVELAVVVRSGFVESRHLGAAVLVDPDGATITALGDPDALVLPRSTMKPLQATAVARSGLAYEGERLVLSTASHAGTARHVEAVAGMLADAGLDEDALGCPPDWPGDPAARVEAVRPRRLAMNCSGKHAAFLGACVAQGWSTDDYLSPDHALQRLVLETVEDLAGERVAHSAVDGCGAPVHALTLGGLARGLAALVRGGSPLPAAILAHPWAIDGPGRANTVTIERTGLVAKLGAEGLLVLITPSGATLALKMLDGSGRATTLVGLELLVREGLLPRDRAAAVLGETLETITGAGRPVGAIRVAF